MSTNRSILQIMPAEGWGARFTHGDHLDILPLMGWALTKDGGKTSVVGLLAAETVAFADEQTGFQGYAWMDEYDDLLDPDEGLDEFDMYEELDDDDDQTPPPSRPTRLN